VSEATRLLTLQFLEWMAAVPRPYAEVMDAWRTSCPRLPVWEDAVDGGLVRLDHREGTCWVTLTANGRAALPARARAA